MVRFSVGVGRAVVVLVALTMFRGKKNEKEVVVESIELDLAKVAAGKGPLVKEPRRTSIDKALGAKMRREEKESRRTSVDMALGRKMKRAEGLCPPSSSDEEEEVLEYFENNEGLKDVATPKPKVKDPQLSERKKRPKSKKRGENVFAASPGDDKGAKAKGGEPEQAPGAGAADEAETGGGDDEFDYAFEGKPREGKTHKREYVATEAPSNLFMGRSDTGKIAEGPEEEEEDEKSPGPKAKTAETKPREERQKSIEMTADQWDAIIQIQYEDEEVNEQYMLDDTVIYEEAIEALSPNLDPKFDVSEYEPTCCMPYQSLMTLLFNKPEFLKRDKACIMHLAEKKFENDNCTHESLLASIYCTIYGTDANKVGRYGKHWESIGFQGNNPATDLRDTGIWGLMQILFFVEHCFNFTQLIFDYSHDPNYGFPFCVIALNICGIGLDLMHNGDFDGPSVDIGSLHKAFNIWYCGAMNVFFRTWKESKSTMEDSGNTMAVLRKQLLTKSTIRKVMVEGSVLSEEFAAGDMDEEMAMEEEIQFSQI